jgi:hypothetical protein
MKPLSQKCAQLTTYFAGGESTYLVNMRTILGETNFKIGDKYNIYLRAEMNDVAVVPIHHRAERFLLSSSMMRFQNYETPVGKQSSKAEMVSYGSFPMFFNTNTTCNAIALSSSVYHTFILEGEVGTITMQCQSQVNNTLNGAGFPNYYFIFDIYKCA